MENSKTKDRFFLWRPLVFAPIFSYENGDLKKKICCQYGCIEVGGTERECGRKYIVFGRYGLRLPPLSSEH